MGDHYVPQAHLRRFEIDDEPGVVWMFDKKSGRFVRAGVGAVAQEAGFYSPEVEKALADVVESPGNLCVAKLRRREKLDNADRSRLSLYMMIMATRGPRKRQESLKIAPQAITDVVAELRQQIDKWIEQEGDNAEVAKLRLRELESAGERFSKELPREVLDRIRAPFWSEATVECILNMAWHILQAPPSMYFVTSDTPAHFFDGIGLGNVESEFTFPIAKDLALIGEHRSGRRTVFEHPRPQIVKEVNRRLISHATRFVFAPQKEPWIEAVALKPAPSLNLIRWG
jgi:hypothetical protein